MNNFIRILFIFCLMPALASAQKHSIQLGLDKGMSFRHRIQTTTQITQTIRQQPLVIEYTTDCYLRFDVTAVRDSVYELSATYDSLALLMDLPTGTFRFRSAGADSAYYSKLLAALTKSTIKISVDKSGHLLGVNGCDEAINALPQLIPQPDTLQKNQALAQLMQLFGNQAFATMIQNMLVVYPGTMVGIDGNWPYKMKQSIPYPIIADGVLTLESATKSSYNIKGSMMVSSDTAIKSSPLINNMPVNYNFSGSLMLSAFTAMGTGLITTSTRQLEMKGIATIPDNPALPGGILIPVSVRTKTVITAY